MYLIKVLIIFLTCATALSKTIIETSFHYRIEPGKHECFLHNGSIGQLIEVQYQVTDGHHGDLDIIFNIFDPRGEKITADKKKTEDTVMMEVQYNGEHSFCLDNKHSLINTKLVYMYILIENKEDEDHETTVQNEEGEIEEEILQYTGYDDEGKVYYVDVPWIIGSLSTTLSHLLKARRLLDLYSATKCRDSHLAFEEIFVVDVWSSFQIVIMLAVGLLQVYMIKKLFKSSNANSFKSHL